MKIKSAKQLIDIEFINMWGDSPSYKGQKLGPQHYENGTGLWARTPEKITSDARKGALVVSSRPEWYENFQMKGVRASIKSKNHINNSTTKCIKCNRILPSRIYHRWHGDKCKYLENTQIWFDIINEIKSKRFTSDDIKIICLKTGYKFTNMLYILRTNPEYIKVIKIGTNQHNPSIYEKTKNHLTLDNE